MPLVTPETVSRLIDEGAETVASLAMAFPATRGAPRRSDTLVRWIRHGLHGGSVKLEGFVGPDGAWWSSKKALARFFAARTGTTPQAVPTDAERKRRAEAAARAMREES